MRLSGQIVVPAVSSHLGALSAATIAAQPIAPNNPGWVAPAVVVSLFGVLVNLIFNGYNAARANLKSQVSDEVSQRLEEYRSRVSTPISTQLDLIQKFAANYSVLKTHRVPMDAATAKIRSIEADKLQREGFTPPYEALTQCLAVAESWCRSRSRKEWRAEIDLLDPMFNELNFFSREQIYQLDDFDRHMNLFQSAANTFLSHMRDEISEEEKRIRSNNSFRWYQLWPPKLTW